MAKKEERRTIFRRIGGRIVPISVGVGAVGVGHAVGSGKVYDAVNKQTMKASKLRSMREFKTNSDVFRNRFSESMRKKYSRELAETGVNDVLTHHPALMPWDQRTSLLLSYDRTNALKSKQILIRSPSRFSFLHELGHAKLQEKGHWSAKLNKKLTPLKTFDEARHFNFPKIMKISGPNTLKRKVLISKPVQKLAAFGGKQVRAVGMAGLAAEETMAWIHGAKYLRTSRQKIAMLKSAVKPLSSYTNFPMQQGARLGLFGLGAGAIAYGLLKKDKKK